MAEGILKRMFVEIRALENGAYRVVARLTWPGSGSVAIEGDADLVADLGDGIEDRLREERVTPADGYRFLALVSEQYQNPYLLATPPTEIPYGD